MVSEPIFLDLSSSDDDDEDHQNGSADSTLLYIAKVFHMDVDDDDVKIIDKPASNGKVKRDKARVVRTTLDDDDCCILDTDPGADAAPDIVSSLNTDELVMTGEKGPVACRDFPHARYLCVHFPFKSTLHAKFCAQCHCYVCDSLAPCSLWGEGNSPNDHCHATEEPRWKSLRKIAKYGSVTSLAAPTTGAADPTGGSRLIRTTPSQTTLPSCTPHFTTLPVDPLGVPRVATPGKRDPLVIQLKGKGRGKVSQPPHLGVKNVRHKSNLRKSVPGFLFPSQPRPTSPPSGRLEDGAPLSTAAHPPHVTPNLSFRLGRAGGGVPTTVPPHPCSMPSRNTLPNRGGVVAASPPHPRPMQGHHTLPSRAGGVAMTQPTVQLPQPTLYPNSAPYYPSVSAASYIPPPPTVTNGVLQAPGAEAPTVPAFVSAGHLMPDRRYVSASPLRDQQVYIDQRPEDHASSQPHMPSMVTGSHVVAQDSRTPVDAAQNASSSHGFSNRGTVDILAGPIEGWEVDAAAPFDSFAAGILAGGSPEHGATSLNDVIQQMAADDYLWESYTAWQ